MKKNFRSKNIILVIALAFLVFLGSNFYFSNPTNLAKLEVDSNPSGIISIQETNN